MTIKDILAKVTKGETLTAEEKTFLEGYDPQKDLDAAAAAARKKAEADATKAAADAAALKTQLEEAQAKLETAAGKGKTDLQKLQEQVSTLTQQVAATTAEKAKLVRQQKLDDVIRESGVKFVREVDGGIMRGAMVNEFASLTDEDLANAEKTQPVIETFRARNKAVILDESGHGAGGLPHQASSSAEDRAKKIENMSADERRADLKKSGIL